MQTKEILLQPHVHVMNFLRDVPPCFTLSGLLNVLSGFPTRVLGLFRSVCSLFMLLFHVLTLQVRLMRGLQPERFLDPLDSSTSWDW